MPESDLKSELKRAASGHPELLPQIEAELDLMESVDDIEGKGNVLQKFYGIWRNNAGRVGHENKINSWTAYAIGLTGKRPDGEFLPERRAFARKGFPDIDSDFDDERRDEVVAHVVEKYGRANVGNIGTYAALHMKSSLRRVVKALDIAGSYHKGPKAYKTDNEAKGGEIVASIPPPQGNKIIWVDEDGGEHHIKTVRDAYKWVPDFKHYIEKYPDIMRHTDNIEGLLSTFSVHASGIVIANAPLSDLAPLRPAKKKKVWDEALQEEVAVQSYATQFAYEDCESIGLIKFDILGLKTLSTIRQCVELVKKNYDIDIDIHNMPVDDKRTFSLFKQGYLTGIFQCENFGMQRVMREIGVDRFEDIMAAIALYRPGPMVNIPSYIARKRGQERISYFHPTIEPHVKPFLAKTYGVCVYQEQIMQLCVALSGFSITDGYGVIKGVAKKLTDLLGSYRKRFIAGCVRNGVPEEVATQYWDEFVIPFADYGFNAAHSCCYGYNSYLTAYLKAHYPEEYMTACLNVEAKRKKWERVVLLERECKRMGIDIADRSKSLNAAGQEYEIVRHADPARNVRAEIRPSILCKGLSLAAAKNLVSQKPFVNMRDFATRTSRKVDTLSIESLAEAGFFGRRGHEMVTEFEAIRSDLKKALRRGVQSIEIDFE